ncbi:tyrosine-type recombinase/integrase [Mangrovibacillus cuniculi]|uniref:Tyrosine-type recombinase/integrase n=1 Tax=Mangrovibacillus cuniculi TaxID=2593652 RepID=A0A7S8CCB7_9BACI|nr:tyrosine-type recombinase/integrase [Mangrovibacillus cuniculi]QPC47372.1 tyrosine-type recombinase/integrase [Mangrovibacillus cuniculi]
MSLKRKKRKQVGQLVSTKQYPELPLNEALNIVIAGKKAEGLRERTLVDYVKTWGYLKDWLKKNYPDVQLVSEVTTEMIRNYVNYLKYDAVRYSGHNLIDSTNQRVGLADTTINIRLRVYRALFNFLEREELIEVNPMDKVKLLKQDIDLTNCLSDKEVKAILQQPNQRDYVGFRDFVAINVLLDSGLRINELVNLVANDIDFSTRFITLTSKQNKNRKPRIVPISSYVMKLLLQLITENQKHFRTERIFLSTYGEPLSANHLNKRLKYHAEKAGVEKKKVTAHVYRHTWAKNMILNGCDAFTLQKMGGWSDIRTMRRYIQMDVSDMRSRHDDFSPINNIRKRKDH